MARLSKQRQVCICCLCVLLALVCAFCLFLPHHHEGEDVQCQMCALSAAYEELWLPTVVTALLLCAVFMLPDSAFAEEGCLGKTLVRLKVKLSD